MGYFEQSTDELIGEESKLKQLLETVLIPNQYTNDPYSFRVGDFLPFIGFNRYISRTSKEDNTAKDIKCTLVFGLYNVAWIYGFYNYFSKFCEFL